MIARFQKLRLIWKIQVNLINVIIFSNKVLLPKQPLHIPHTPIPFSQQLRLANLYQRAGFTAFAVVGRRSLAAV